MQAQNFVHMATYNQWMNERLYECARQLSEEQLRNDMGAFFGSILGTLNHLVVADIIWLRRFANHPADFQSLHVIKEMRQPKTLDETYCDELEGLATIRQQLDDSILEFAKALNEENLNTSFSYQNTKGVQFNNRLGFPLQHFFNHQTHHRGQLTTLFNQLDIDVGVTDLLVTIRDSDVQ